MKRFERFALIFSVLALALTGCGNEGDDDDDFQVIDSTGSGSESLRVTASIEIIGDGTPDNLGATTTIAVKDQTNAPASAAVVTLQHVAGEVTLIEDPVGTGIFTVASGDILPWSEGYALRIERGSDVVDEVTIAAPVLHEMTNPPRFHNHFANQPMDVEWTGGDTADEYRVELDSNLNPHTSWQPGDPGTFRIEGTYFPPGQGAYTEIVIVRRKKTLQLTGTLPASSLSIEIKQEVDPIAINPPAS